MNRWSINQSRSANSLQIHSVKENGHISLGLRTVWQCTTKPQVQLPGSSPIWKVVTVSSFFTCEWNKEQRSLCTLWGLYSRGDTDENTRGLERKVQSEAHRFMGAQKRHCWLWSPKKASQSWNLKDGKESVLWKEKKKLFLAGKKKSLEKRGRDERILPQMSHRTQRMGWGGCDAQEINWTKKQGPDPVGSCTSL